jgi:hyperosmotically inducible periplasmic protein
MTHLRMKWIAAVSLAVWSVACSKSDAGITTAIKTKLAADDQVKAYQIDVDTRDRIVTLSGRVDSAQAKTRAADIARAQEGVSQVVDNIMATEAGPMPMVPDASVTAAVKTALLADTTISGRRIDVDSREGVVTLSGVVRSQAEKEIALQIARDATGVREVRDRLVIAPR